MFCNNVLILLTVLSIICFQGCFFVCLFLFQFFCRCYCESVTCCGSVQILLSLRFMDCNHGVSSTPDNPLWNTDLYKKQSQINGLRLFEVIQHNCTSASSTLHVSIVPLAKCVRVCAYCACMFVLFTEPMHCVTTGYRAACQDLHELLIQTSNILIKHCHQNYQILKKQKRQRSILNELLACSESAMREDLACEYTMAVYLKYGSTLLRGMLMPQCSGDLCRKQYVQ